MAAESCRAGSFSIADITFKLLKAHMGRRWLCAMPGPWSRKISATSKAGRDTRAASSRAGRISLSLRAMCSSGLMTSLIVLVATRV